MQEQWHYDHGIVHPQEEKHNHHITQKKTS